MKRIYLFVLLLFVIGFFSACVATPLTENLAAETVAASPTASEDTAAVTTAAVADEEPGAEASSEASTEAGDEPQPVLDDSVPDPADSATPEPPTLAPELEQPLVPASEDEPAPEPAPERIAPSSEFVRDHALDFLRGAYRMTLPDNAGFVQAELPLDTPGFDLVNAFESAPYQVFIGSPYLVGERLVTPAIVYNPRSETRWWGEVDDAGLVNTVVAARMPRTSSTRVDGWIGRLVKLPPGSPYDDYFEGRQGNRHGIDTNRDNVAVMLESLTDYDGRIRIDGELLYGVPDYNGRRILVRHIELLDELNPPPETTPGPAEAASILPDPTPFFGPIGAFTSPGQGEVLDERVQVEGEAEGLPDNQVVVRVETAAGEVLGEALLTTAAAEPGGKGRFSAEIAILEPPTAGPGRVALYAENTNDGSLELMAWTNVKLAGPTSGKSAAIFRPAADSRVKGTIVVGGEAIGVVNDVVLVRVEDLTGAVLGQSRARVDAGEWSTSIAVRRPRTPRAGRIAVYDIDPADGSVSLLAAIGVRLAR